MTAATATRRLSYVAQNVILGTITGLMVGYNLKVLFQRFGGTELVWVLFLGLGSLLGYVSGKERQRVDRLRKEKSELKENLGKIESALKSYSQKYRPLVEYANDAIFLTTEQGRFLLFNEATCLLTGYTRKELKSVNVGDLRAADSSGSRHRAWSDNGFCRYEEKWYRKDGSLVAVESNARLIRLREHRLILRVVRNIIKRNEANHEDRAKQIRAIHENGIVEAAAVHRDIVRRLLSSVENTQNAVQENIVKHPNESAKLAVLLSDWEKNRKFLQLLQDKCRRDLKTSPARWDLNAILKEEILYLRSIMDIGGCIKELDLSKKLPPAYGFGRDFSFVFGNVFKAAIDSIHSLKHRDIAIISRPLDDHILVEIRVGGAASFKEELCKQVDPFIDHEEMLSQDEIEMKFGLCQSIFESFGVRIDVGRQEREGTIIRIRFPVADDEDEKSRESQRVDAQKSVII